MEYQIIPNWTYLDRPVYTRNPALPDAANADDVAGSVPYNSENDNVPPVNADNGQTQDWTGLHNIMGMGGKKRTRKYLSKNKRKSRKRRRV
jgi:hypothetical protein